MIGSGGAHASVAWPRASRRLGLRATPPQRSTDRSRRWFGRTGCELKRLPGFYLRLVVGLAIALLSTGVDRAFAQEPANPPSRPDPTGVPGAAKQPPGTTAPQPQPPKSEATVAEIRPARPDVYYLKDKDGRLVPVPDFSYEDFKRLYDLDRQLTDTNPPPSFVLQNLKLSGSADEQTATLKVEIRVTTRNSNWVRIPLRFNGAVLRAQPQYDGPGTLLFEYDRDRDGYVAWLQEKDERPHSLKFEILAAVKPAGEGKRLSLIAPTATTSDLRLTVPGKQIAAAASAGASVLGVRAGGKDRQEIEVAGVVGDFQLTWTPRVTELGQRSVTLEAASSITVRVEGPRRISSEARLKVRGYGAPLESFRVRLPIGMEFFPLNEPGTRVALVENARDKGQLVEVTPDTRGAYQSEVRLRAVLPLEGAAADERIETLGFEVLGAVRQFGQIDCIVEGDWAVTWPERIGVLVLDVPDAARAQRIAARFEFFRQPSSLKVQVQPRRTRISVEPTYTLSVEPEQLRIDALLKYKIRGPAAQRVLVDLDGWKIDQIQPEQLLDTDALQTSQTAPLTIPLSSEDGVNLREFELRVRATRPLEVGDEPLLLNLPRPQANFISPPRLIVTAADNVIVSPRFRDMPGVVAQQPPGDLNLPARQQAPLAFELRADLENWRFAAGIQLRPRSMTATLTTSVRLEVDRAAVEQRFHYRVAYEPVRQVELIVPEPLAPLLDSGSLQVFQIEEQGELTPLTLHRATDDEARLENGAAVLVADLAREAIGEFRLLVRFEGNWASSVEPLGSTPWDIPLVGPLADPGTQLTSQRVQVVTAAAIHADARAGDWLADRIPIEAPSKLGELRLVTTKPASFLPLRVSPGGLGASGGTRVSRAWLQTWLGPDARQDRMAMRVQSRDSHLELEFPAGTQLDDLVVALNGQAIAPERAGDGRVRVELADAQLGAEQLLELSYLVRSDSSRTRRRIDFPVVRGAPYGHRFYWQIVLPADDYLFGAPAMFTPESRWTWLHAFSERRGRWTQQELEQWIGASSQPAPPSDSNEYLFCRFGGWDAVDVFVVSRGALILLGSGAILALGLIAVYTPWLKHPIGLFAAGVAGVGGALWAPDVAILLLQAGVLGILLTAISHLLRRRSQSKRLSRSVVRGTSISALALSGIDQPATDSRSSRLGGMPQPTTATLDVRS